MKSQFYTTSHTRAAAGHPLTPSESQADTCKQTRSRPALGDRPSLAHTLSVHGMRGNHHPFSTFPHARCCAAGNLSRGRSRPGKVRRHWRRGGRLSPRPENLSRASFRFQAPLAEQRGGRPRRSPDSAGRRTAPRFFSGRLGVPHAKITLHFAKSWIFPLATGEPAFSGKAKYEHSNECPRTKRETAVGATATTLRERRHHFHRSWKCYLVEPARRAG